MENEKVKTSDQRFVECTTIMPGRDGAMKYANKKLAKIINTLDCFTKKKIQNKNNNNNSNSNNTNIYAVKRFQREQEKNG